MDDLSPAELREVRKAIRAAYERGRAAERREFDAFLARMRALKELNGSGDAFLKAYSDREPPREEGRRPDPHAAVAEAMLAHAEESMAAGDDHLPGVEALRKLLDDPAELGRVLADGGADDESVGKAVWSVLKAWEESKHPRDHGKFSSAPGGGDGAADADRPGRGERSRLKIDVPDRHGGDDAFDVAVIKNPTADDVLVKAKSLRSSSPIRGLVSGGDVYVWWEDDVHHQPVHEALDLPGRADFKDRILIYYDRDEDRVSVETHSPNAAVAGWARANGFAYEADTTTAKAVRRVAGWGARLYVLKAWDESKHPRGKNGHFISRDRIDAAKSDPKLAEKLKEEVKPEDAGKLDAALEGKTDLGRTKRGEARHQAGQRRATREEAKAKTAKFLGHLKRVGDLKAELTADDLHDLADHLGSEHVTIDDVRAMRKALAGAGTGRASFGGAQAKADMVKALQAHAKRAAFEARMREHGIGGADAEDMRAAVGLGAKEETPAPAPAERTPPATGGQYGAWGRAAAGEATPPETAAGAAKVEPESTKQPQELSDQERAYRSQEQQALDGDPEALRGVIGHRESYIQRLRSGHYDDEMTPEDRDKEIARQKGILDSLKRDLEAEEFRVKINPAKVEEDIFNHLTDAGKPLTAHEVGRGIGLTRGHVRQMMENLAREGEIYRRVNIKTGEVHYSMDPFKEPRRGKNPNATTTTAGGVASAAPTASRIDPARTTPVDPQVELAKLPGAVRNSVEHALNGLKDHADSLEHARRTDAMFRGNGRYEREVNDSGKEKVAAHLAKLDQFRQLAAKNGVDADAVISALGGMPAHEPSPAGRDYRFADEPDLPDPAGSAPPPPPPAPAPEPAPEPEPAPNAAAEALKVDGANPGELAVESVDQNGVLVRYPHGTQQFFDWDSLDRNIDRNLLKKPVVASLRTVRDATRGLRPAAPPPPPPPPPPEQPPAAAESPPPDPGAEPDFADAGRHAASGLRFATAGDAVRVTGNTREHAAALRRAGFRWVPKEVWDEDVPMRSGAKLPGGYWEGTLDHAANLGVPRGHDIPTLLGVRTKTKVGGRKVVVGRTASVLAGSAPPPPAPAPAPRPAFTHGTYHADPAGNTRLLAAHAGPPTPNEHASYAEQALRAVGGMTTTDRGESRAGGHRVFAAPLGSGGLPGLAETAAAARRDLDAWGEPHAALDDSRAIQKRDAVAHMRAALGRAAPPASEPEPGKAPRRNPAATRKPAGKPPASPTPPAPAPAPVPQNLPTQVDSSPAAGNTTPTPATVTGGTRGSGKVDAKKLSPKESDELERIIAGAGSLPESVAGHPDPTGFAADLLDRIESGDADADDVRTVHGWLLRDADRYGRGPSGSRSEAARLAALVAKMGGLTP